MWLPTLLERCGCPRCLVLGLGRWLGKGWDGERQPLVTGKVCLLWLRSFPSFVIPLQ